MSNGSQNQSRTTWIIVLTLIILIILGYILYSLLRNSTNNPNFNQGQNVPSIQDQNQNQNQNVLPEDQSTQNVRGVTINPSNYSPSTITVRPGTLITWINNDSAAHTVTSSQGLFDSGNLLTGQTFQFVFDRVGTFSYFCKIHPNIKGEVVVQQ